MTNALLATFVFAISVAFSSTLESQFTLPKLLCLHLFTPLLIVAWLLELRRGAVRALPRSVAIVAGALAVWWCIVTVQSLDPGTSLRGLYGRYNGLLTHLTMLAIFVVTATLPSDTLEERVRLVVLALLPAAAWAVLQFLGFDPRPWPNPRPASTIGHPVPLAAMLALAAPPVAAFVLSEPDAWRRRTGMAVLTLLGAAILVTLSRGPWAGAAVAITLVGVWAIRQRLVHGDRQLMIVLTALVAIAAVRAVASDSDSLLTRRLASIRALGDDPSFVNRFTYAEAGWRMFVSHPVVGNGFDHFGLLYTRYRGVEPASVPVDQLPTRVHNGFLDRAVAEGLPGAALHAALIGLVLIAAWRRGRSTGDDRQRLLAVALLASIVGFIIQDLSGWDELPLSVYFWIVLGLSVSAANAPAATTRPLPRLPLLVTMAALFAMIVAAQAYGTWRAIRGEQLIVAAAQSDPRVPRTALAEDIERALVLGGGSDHYLDRAGLVFLKRFAATRQELDYRDSARLFDRALDRNRFDSYLHLHRIDLETLALQSKIVAAATPGAVRAVDLITAIDPNNATVYASLARFYLAAGRLPDALAASQRAHALRPSQPQHHVIDGDIYAAMHNLPEQIAAYNAALGGADEQLWPEVVRKLILSLVSAGRHAEAITLAQTAIARAPNDVILHNLLGVAFLETHQRAQALGAFRKAIELDPSNAAAARGLAEAAKP